MVLHQSAPWLNQVMVLLLKEKPLVQHVSGCYAIYNLFKILPVLFGCLENKNSGANSSCLSSLKCPLAL